MIKQELYEWRVPSLLETREISKSSGICIQKDQILWSPFRQWLQEQVRWALPVCYIYIYIYIYTYIYIYIHTYMSPVPSHLIILYAIVFFFFFFFFFFLGPRRIHLCGSHTRKSSVYLEKHCAQTRGYYSPEQYNDIFVYLSKNFYTSFG